MFYHSSSKCIRNYNQSIYWAVSTVNKWKAQCSGPYNLSIVQYTAYCTTVSILRLSPSHLQQPVCSLNWLILVVLHHLKQVESILSGCVQSICICSLFVFDCCHLCLPVWMTCALECRMWFENENVVRVLLKSLSEICNLCFTMWNGLRYRQPTA